MYSVEIPSIQHFLHEYNLRLNVKKTNYFTSKRNTVWQEKYQSHYDNQLITRGQNTKLLGLVIDESTWRTTTVQVKLRNMNALTQIYFLYNIDILSMIYLSYFTHTLSMGCKFMNK